MLLLPPGNEATVHCKWLRLTGDLPARKPEEQCVSSQLVTLV